MTDAILDTTFFIDLRSQKHQGAMALWQEIQAGTKTAAVSPITIYELWVGSTIGRTEEAFYEACFSFLEETNLSSSSARMAGVWLRTRGDRTEALFRDALIAATAVERGEPVFTTNVRDFSSFAGVRVETY